MNTLYLASKSSSRKYLLQEARIPFVVIDQHADEKACDWTSPIEQLVAEIARCKMEHVVLPVGKEGEICFVLTADTLCEDSYGMIHGKPENYEEAVKKVKLLRDGSRIVTAFYIDKKEFKNDKWQLLARHHEVVASRCLFVVPDADIERYFKEHPIALQAAGALAIEHYGLRYLKSIEGSFTNIIGLPIYEVCRALKAGNFFEAA